jgi:cell division protein FtsB
VIRLPRLASLGDRRVRRLFVAALVVAGILFTFGNPARTWYDQHQDIAAARERNDVLDEQSRQLEARAAQLRTDAEVERIAREQYGLVKPGEEAFGILPAPGSGAGQPPPPSPPPPPPRPWWERAWDTATFWD